MNVRKKSKRQRQRQVLFVKNQMQGQPVPAVEECRGSMLWGSWVWTMPLTFMPSSESVFLFLFLFLQCHTNYIPVCGSNGDTYQNECFLRRAACKHQKDITVVARGPCYSGMYDVRNGSAIFSKRRLELEMFGSHCRGDWLWLTEFYSYFMLLLLDGVIFVLTVCLFYVRLSHILCWIAQTLNTGVGNWHG